MSRREPSRAPDVPFARQTALAHWALARLGAPRWDALPLDALKAAERAPWLTTPTPFAEALTGRGAAGGLPDDALARLDARVFAATRRVNARRGAAPIRWRYFQYLALLLTELYLERYLGDPGALRRELNDFLREFCDARGLALPRYGEDPDTGADELARLAFWQATGSGKTLQLHANYYQHAAARARHGLAPLDNVLLITPSAALARQHARELARSGIVGAVLRKPGPGGARPGVHVVEITRFRDKPGPETMHPDHFEGRNLVLVDEGHRGSTRQDGEWRRARRRLAARGFCFEYSATFAQAARDPMVAREYARSVLFDYAYRRFHGDGYGKHWRVFNLRGGPGRDAPDGAGARAYLTAGLAALYQQLRVYAQSPALAREHNLARPLAIFVGASVTGGAASRREQTDALRVIELLARLVHPGERAHNARLLGALLAGDLGFQARDGADVFDPRDMFSELGRAGLSGEQLHAAMLRVVCNTEAPGPLRVRALLDAPGELALSVGERPPFAVINVGDAPGLRRRCEQARFAALLRVEDGRFRGSLFDGLDAPGSPITILIGSRKFAEGWSSWRVSHMGLLNLGRAPGAQIVQLFGRGVRLLGKDRSLRRASDGGPAEPGSPRARLRVLETLNVFGVRADYIDRLVHELRAEGLAPESAAAPARSLPIVTRAPLPRLRVLLAPSVAYVDSRERPTLALDPAVPRVLVDAYPRVQRRDDGDARPGARGPRHATRGPVPAFAFVDHRRLYAALVELKRARGWTNLALPRRAPAPGGGEEPLTRGLLRAGGWYELRAPPHLLRPASLAQLELWQQLAQELVCAYASAFYRHHRRRYQLRGATLAWLHALPPAPRAAFLPDAYELLVETDGAAGVPAPTLDLPEHLYAPLLVDASGTRARPPALARDEARFVQTLSEWRAASPGRAASLSLLRLPEGEHGRALVGGPGFLLWTTRGAARRLVYVVFLRARGQLERWLCERPWEPLGAVQAEPGAPAVTVDAWAITTLERARAPKQLRDGADARRRHVAFQRERGHLEPLLG